MFPQIVVPGRNKTGSFNVGYSSDKAGKPKRKGEQTPDKVATPVPSSAGVVDENAPGNQTITNVLSGEDIDSLAVSIEELQKVSDDMILNHNKILLVFKDCIY
jgi:hypothetical protein